MILFVSFVFMGEMVGRYRYAIAGVTHIYCAHVYLFKTKIIFNFLKFVVTKKVRILIFSPPLLLLLLDPGSGTDESQDPGFGIKKPQEKST